jgi:tRNA threonylcarbamoyladenosine biosynthesis protein TsaE
MEYITQNSQETFDLGKSFANKLKGGEIIALFGDLGSGKTTFTKGVADGLGIKKDITSPTFVISKLYHFGSDRKLVHIDSYRLNSSDDFESIGLFEQINSNTVIVVEWPEKIWSKIKEYATRINFEYINENERKITVGDR